MLWVQIQKASEVTWSEYEQVAAAVGDLTPPGLVLHAAGDADGRWQAVSVWTSKEAFEAFRDEHLLPAVRSALGPDVAGAGPPATEWFAALHVIPAGLAGE